MPDAALAMNLEAIEEQLHEIGARNVIIVRSNGFVYLAAVFAEPASSVELLCAGPGRGRGHGLAAGGDAAARAGAAGDDAG